MIILLGAHVFAIDRALLRTWFKCSPCDAVKCMEPPSDCKEYVKEPGYCSCCLTCAREEGETCGVNLPQCQEGLQCEPIVDENTESQWHAIFADNAVCIRKGKAYVHMYFLHSSEQKGEMR